MTHLLAEGGCVMHKYILNAVQLTSKFTNACNASCLEEVLKITCVLGSCDTRTMLLKSDY